jgi:hypothetical protein
MEAAAMTSDQAEADVDHNDRNRHLAAEIASMLPYVRSEAGDVLALVIDKLKATSDASPSNDASAFHRRLVGEIIDLLAPLPQPEAWRILAIAEWFLQLPVGPRRSAPPQSEAAPTTSLRKEPLP